MTERPLDGKVAIITGAGSPIGIGHAIALGLVWAGARVALTDINQGWLASDDSREFNGRRIIAYNWDDNLPLAERLEDCSAPAAWPQLGQQAVRLNRQ